MARVDMEKPAPGFLDEGIGLGNSDLSIPPPPPSTSTTSAPISGIPVRTRIIKIGCSSCVVIPAPLFKLLGFRIGDYVTVTIQRRKPDPDEVERDRRRKCRA